MRPTSSSAPSAALQLMSGCQNSANASRPPRSYAAKYRRTISTFSCDIARSVSRGGGKVGQRRAAVARPPSESNADYVEALSGRTDSKPHTSIVLRTAPDPQRIARRSPSELAAAISTGRPLKSMKPTSVRSSVIDEALPSKAPRSDFLSISTLARSISPTARTTTESPSRSIATISGPSRTDGRVPIGTISSSLSQRCRLGAGRKRRKAFDGLKDQATPLGPGCGAMPTPVPVRAAAKHRIVRGHSQCSAGAHDGTVVRDLRRIPRRGCGGIAASAPTSAAPWRNGRRGWRTFASPRAGRARFAEARSPIALRATPTARRLRGRRSVRGSRP